MEVSVEIVLGFTVFGLFPSFGDRGAWSALEPKTLVEQARDRPTSPKAGKSHICRRLRQVPNLEKRSPCTESTEAITLEAIEKVDNRRRIRI